MQNRLTITLLFVLFIIPIHSSGQKLVNSPFSRFNLGSMEPAGSFRSIGMGGTGTAFRDNNAIYLTNPASYSSLDTNSFIFDFGLDYSINLLSEGETELFSDDINFDHLIIGFPLAKGLGLAAGVVPVSNGYYKIASSITQGDPGYDPVTGGYSEYHAGEGSLSKFFLGSGIMVTKDLSAGINMTVLFGEIKRVNQYYFLDYYNVYHNNNTERLQISGLNFDYGLQYSKEIKKDYFINAGASLSSGKHYNSEFETVAFSYSAYGSSDTLSYFNDDASSAYLPGTLRLGLAFGKKNKLTAGFDLVSTEWSKAKFHGADGYLGDTKSYLFGLEYIPDKFSNYSTLKRIEYRIGGHFADNYLVIDGKQVKEAGVSIGFGLPLRRSFSKTNIFFDFTKKSVSGETIVINENYFTVGISLNLYDRWFIQRKYD